MSLITHTFDSETHNYLVQGEYVISTSSVIELNGLSDFSMVPVANLRHAGHRGTALHLAVLAYETECDVEDAVCGYEEEHKVEVFVQVMERMSGYMRWRDEHEVKLAGKMEQTRVYRHVGTEQLIGGTPDMPCWIDGELFILDPKTCFKQYGMMAKQLMFKWKLQTQSYSEALDVDEEFWSNIPRQPINRAILHLHPECGKSRGNKAAGFEFHPFRTDDSFLWDSAIRMAMGKLSHGYKLDKKN
jgi:hypothetical protein